MKFRLTNFTACLSDMIVGSQEITDCEIARQLECVATVFARRQTFHVIKRQRTKKNTAGIDSGNVSPQFAICAPPTGACNIDNICTPI